MRSLFFMGLLLSLGNLLFGQTFIFNYDGPDTLFVDDNCQVVLDWGHPDQPTVSSGIGANIDSFYIYEISNDYEINEMVEAGLSIDVTYKAVDDQGNSAFFTFTLYTIDNSFPVLESGPNDEIHACNEPGLIDQLQAWYEGLAGIQATDNCSVFIYPDRPWEEVLIDFNQSVNSNCGNTRSVEISFSIEDEQGNTLPGLTATFETLDNTDPVITVQPQALDTFCVSDIYQVLEAWLDNRGGTQAEDDCSDQLEWYFLWNIENTNLSGYEQVGNKPYELQVLNNLCEFNVNINFIAADDCGNQEASFTTISIIDNNTPTFDTLPSDTIVDCDAIPGAIELKAFDLCKGELIVLFESVSDQGDNPLDADYYNYTITRNWSASDGCGHDIMHSRHIFVQDTTAPDFLVPGEITISCESLHDTLLTGIPTQLEDNCSDHLEMYYNDRQEGSGCSYTVYRDWYLVDVSGNEKIKTQVINIEDTQIPVVSTLPSDQSVFCYETASAEQAFYTWRDNLGAATFTDACNSFAAFAAVPGSYDIDNQATFPGQLPNADFLLSCAGNDDQVMFRQVVDFVFHDECGNVVVYTREFTVIDDVDPEITECRNDTTLTVPVDECGINFVLDLPQSTDNCTGSELVWSYSQNFTIASAIPGDTEIPVDTLTISLGPIDLFELDLEDLSKLKLSFFNIDADDSNEYFVIRGEDGTVLDTTPEINEECGDFEIELKDIISYEQFEEWLDDEYLELVLEPKIVPAGGVFSINDICGTSYVNFSLEYITAPVSELNYYYSFDSLAFTEIDPQIPVDTMLTAGEHFLYYRVRDCAGNESECVQKISALDQQPPVIQCPDAIQTALPTDSCTLPLTIPLDFSYGDNCLETWKKKFIAPMQINKRYIQFDYDPDSDEFIAVNKSFSFEINGDNYISNPVLTVFIQADVDEPGEFFEILDENGQVIGQTPPGSCDSFSMVQIILDPSDFTEWNDDHIINFVARSAIDLNAVNPCDPEGVNTDGDTDGVSQLYFELSFDRVDLRYEVTGQTNISEQALSEAQIPPVHLFNGGLSTIHYYLYDEAQNGDTCSVTVNLIDEEQPTAICKQAIAIAINPSGIETYELKPEELDDGSFDNCQIDSMAVSPSLFDCSMAGTTVDVMFYVWDAQGNADSCMTSVKIETLVLSPTYQSGVCAFDTLKLFANLPDAPEGIYSILWSKENNGFSSNEENPVRPNADQSFSGTYTLEVTGVNGCFSTGFVEVFIEDLVTPEITVTRDTICEGETVQLESNSYSGNVIYKWYRGLAPNGTIIDSTNIPSLAIHPGIGTSDFYVEIVSEHCISLPSQKISVTVLETPEAMVNDPFIDLCEGEDLVLGTDVSGPGFEYLWWGPDSYSSVVQNPASIDNVSIKKQGTYRLAIFNGICSDTALVQVLVNERPVMPEIVSDTIFCEGETIVMTVNNITNADTYTWLLNEDLYTVENTNSLVIQDAGDIYSGDWQVIAKEGDCYSDTSDVWELFVELKYAISAGNSGPVCEGDSVQLLAPDIPGAIYTWIGPENDTINISRPTIKAVKGTYFLQVVTQAGCYLDASTDVQVVKVPEITALSNDAPGCIDGTECISFKPSVFPNLTGYSYDWGGPGGFSSSDSIALICEVDTSQNGIYTLVVSNGICESEMASTEVEMFMYPSKPELQGATLLCQNDTLILSAVNAMEDGLDYFWSTPVGNVYQTSNPSLIIPQALLSMTGKYTLQVFNGHCYSEVSEPIYVEVLKKPNQPVVWTENEYCEGDAVKLFTNFVPGAEYHWQGPNGFVADVQNPVIFPSDTLAEGVYRLYVSIDGCYSDISEGVVVEIKRRPDQPSVLPYDQPLCIIDSSTILELCLENQTAGVEYSWYHNESGALLASSSANCVELNNITGIIDGLNGFYVVSEKDGCRSEASELNLVQLDLIPDNNANAGEDIIACDDNELYLDAMDDEDGYWTSANQEILIVDPDHPDTKVMHLPEGDNAFVWSLSHGACIDYDRDSVNVHIINTPVALDDSYQTGYNQWIEIEPIENDQFTDQTVILIDKDLVEYGEIGFTGGNRFVFDPSPAYVGQVTIPYKLVNIDCPDKFSEAIITIDISNANDCFGVNVITPNGDGVNDILLFPCLENPLFPKNKLTVFNQWGDEVFSQSPYQNEWQGTYRGKDLPVGTYYYILELNNGSRPIQDFFVIER
jgi:gliding motility-associated-like protein